MLRAAIYARVSTANQKNENTIRSQVMAIKDKAKKEGFAIVKEYLDEGWSGSTLQRPQLDLLRVEATEDIWDVIIVYDPDRLARKLSYIDLVMEELKNNEKDIVFVTTPSPKNPGDKLLLSMKGVFAEYERDKTAERTRMGKLRKAREGHIITSEGPYGYKYIKKQSKGDRGHYEIDPVEAAVVFLIFDYIGNQGKTIRQMIKELHRLGIKPRKSKRGVWSTSTLSRLLRNEIYIGKAYFNRTKSVVPKKPTNDVKYKRIKKSSRVVNDKNKWIEIPVEPIINEKLFNKVQIQLDKNDKLCPRNRHKNRYLLSGLISCKCGCTRAGEGPQKGKHLYYRCSDRVKKFPLERTCFEGGVNARIADDLVWKKLVKLLTTKELIQQQLNRWLSQRQDKSNDLNVSVESLSQELKKAEKEERRYLKAYGQGLIDDDQLKPVAKGLRERKDSIKNTIANLKTKKRESDVILPSDDLIDQFIVGVKDLIKSADFVLKRDILIRSIDKITATQREMRVFGFIPIEKEYANVKFKTEHRNRGLAQCGQIDFI